MSAHESELLSRVAERTRVREGTEGVRAVIRAIYQIRTAGTREIAEASHLPIPLVAAIRGELSKEGLVEKRNRGAALTERGERFARELFGKLPTSAGASPATDHREYTDLLSELRDIAASRPDVDVTLDQAKATPETLARRVTYLAAADAIGGRRIVCLGDDDYTSAAIAAGVAWEQREGHDTSVSQLTVLDIDERIVDGLDSIDGIAAHVWDARDPVPEDLAGEFDVVVTDPPYSIPGAELFLSRAVEAVGGRAGAKCFFSFGHLDPIAMRGVQAAIAEIGWVIIEMAPGFNTYEGGSVLAGRSMMMHLVLAPNASPVITGRYDGPLYTADIRPMIRLYRCTSCGATYDVGRGQQWLTVEQLKRNHCNECGNDRFARVGQRPAESTDGEA